jgi:endonuclease G
MNNILLTALVITALSTLPAYAGQTDCPDYFLGGSSPEYTNQKVAAKTRQLCNDGFAVGHSGVTRTPLWAAERLTRDGLDAGKGLPRTNDFRADDRLPASERSELRDYSRSGFDRGHQVPAADIGKGKSTTFLMSNMVPQNADNNRNLHEGIESSVRKEVRKAGELFVITGPIFDGENLLALRGRVLVPSGLFKCLYYVRLDKAGCYVERNGPGMEYNVASVSQVENAIGINLFPVMAQAVKDRAIQLPEPKPYSKRRR